MSKLQIVIGDTRPVSPLRISAAGSVEEIGEEAA